MAMSCVWQSTELLWVVIWFFVRVLKLDWIFYEATSKISEFSFFFNVSSFLSFFVMDKVWMGRRSESAIRWEAGRYWLWSLTPIAGFVTYGNILLGEKSGNFFNGDSIVGAFLSIGSFLAWMLAILNLSYWVIGESAANDCESTPLNSLFDSEILRLLLFSYIFCSNFLSSTL